MFHFLSLSNFSKKIRFTNGYRVPIAKLIKIMRLLQVLFHQTNKKCIITQDSHMIEGFLEVVRHCYLKNEITQKLYQYYDGYHHMSADKSTILIAITDNNHIIGDSLFIIGKPQRQTKTSISPTLLHQHFPKLNFTATNYAFIRALCIMPEHANR